MMPDFPTPETITRPEAAASSCTARANPSSRRVPAVRTAAASTSSTRRPSSTSSDGSNGTNRLLGEVALEQLGPQPAGLEQRLDGLANGAVPAPGAGHIRRDRLDLVHRVGGSDRQAHPPEHLEIRQIVAH